MNQYQEIFEGYSERMNNIVVMLPLLELKQKRKYPYDMLSLGIAVLLFVLEDMLKATKNCSYDSIAVFLQTLIGDYYGDSLSFNQAREISVTLVQEYLRNNGEGFSYEYDDFLEGNRKEFRFSYLEYENFAVKDVQDDKARFKLTEHGLSVLFRSREIFNEMQVSIYQLLLRQQILKGVFDGALRTVEDLGLAVRKERDSLHQLRERIIRDALEVARKSEVSIQFDRIFERLLSDNKTFQELKNLIEDTLETSHKQHLSDKEQEAVIKATKLRRKLMDIVSDHESLFTKKLQIQQFMGESLQSLILNAFASHLNMEQEVLPLVVQNDADLTTLKRVLNPVLPIPQFRIWNPMSVFQEQRARKESQSEEVVVHDFDELMIRAVEEEERQKQREHQELIYLFFKTLVSPLTSKERVRLSDVLDELKQADVLSYEKIVESFHFYPFLIQMHQIGWVPLGLDDEEPQYYDDFSFAVSRLQDEIESLRDIQAFQIQPLPDVLHLKYAMSNFEIVRRGVH